MAPWEGPRHRSWASDTVVMGGILGLLIVLVTVTDYFGDPPTYLVGLMGTAAGAFFAAIGSDKQKRDTDVANKADRAVEKVAEVEHRVEQVETTATTSFERANAAELRESEWFKHRDHFTDDEHGGGEG